MLTAPIAGSLAEAPQEIRRLGAGSGGEDDAAAVTGDRHLAAAADPPKLLVRFLPPLKHPRLHERVQRGMEAVAEAVVGPEDVLVRCSEVAGNGSNVRSEHVRRVVPVHPLGKFPGQRHGQRLTPDSRCWGSAAAGSPAGEASSTG